MALIRFAEGQQRSGSIGASVYSHNRFGPYIRARSVPVNPSTDRQVAARNAVRALAILWQTTLTQPQRDAWAVYASNVEWRNKFGDAVNLTALNHYVRCNAARLPYGFARIDTAPAIQDLGIAELALTATASEATQDLTIGGDPDGDWIADPGANQFYSIGLPQNPGIIFFGGPFRATGVTSIGPPPFPITHPAAFPFVEGQRLWLRSRIQLSDGRLSEFAQINFLTDA
ncbi:hypothetical protein ES708_11913 [subsurface metagenome]